MCPTSLLITNSQPLLFQLSLPYCDKVSNFVKKHTKSHIWSTHWDALWHVTFKLLPCLILLPFAVVIYFSKGWIKLPVVCDVLVQSDTTCHFQLVLKSVFLTPRLWSVMPVQRLITSTWRLVTWCPSLSDTTWRLTNLTSGHLMSFLVWHNLTSDQLDVWPTDVLLKVWPVQEI